MALPEAWDAVREHYDGTVIPAIQAQVAMQATDIGSRIGAIHTQMRADKTAPAVASEAHATELGAAHAHVWQLEALPRKTVRRSTTDTRSLSTVHAFQAQCHLARRWSSSPAGRR